MPNEESATRKAHVAIHVTDLARSVEFYERMFGVGPVKVRPGYAKFDLANPPLNFTLNEGPAETGTGLSHLGIQVGSTAEVLVMRDRWVQSGLSVRDEMQTDCCYALQDKSWVRDPDGNEWEVFVVLEDNLPEKTTQSSACCAPTCCAEAVRA